MAELPKAGLYESLLTERYIELLRGLDDAGLAPSYVPLRDAEAADRLARHVAQLLARAIESTPEEGRAAEAIRIARGVLVHLDALVPKADLGALTPVDPGQILEAILTIQPDGSHRSIDRPLTPLLDTTLFTNAPGEPALIHELKGEIPSADNIDVVVAFIRFAGLRPMRELLRRHVSEGKTLRVLTTTYTNSTEQRALDELETIGAEVKVSYDTTSTRLHAKAWIFHRQSGYSTAYVGSSNLTNWAQVDGVEWNVRLAEARNADAIAKMAAVFESYWAGRAFEPYDANEFAERTATVEEGQVLLSPLEIVLRPFQEELLEHLAVARHQGHHRNLLVAATGTGKTVMAAVDYARLRSSLPRARLLFVAHRDEILEQSRSTFRHALRDATFGEKWVGGEKPQNFEHVFASIQSLNAAGFANLASDHFDVVIVDEFHHAAAKSYEALLDHVEPRELLGLTATPERADGLDVLRYFDGRIAAELRVWEAIDQQYLVPFDYFGIHDGADLRKIPWKRSTGYDVNALTDLLTADHAWANRIIDQVRQKVTNPARMRALGFCVSISHARFMAKRFTEAGLNAVAVWGDSPMAERRTALTDLAAGTVKVVFTVDLFNEGVDVPDVDTLLMLRPTESGTLFLQQLGRGLRKAHGKSVCTVLDFVGLQNAEFRFDKKYRALLGGSRKDLERHVHEDFPFLPAGCTLELDRVAREEVLRSIKEAIPSTWKERVSELKALGDVSLEEYLAATDLELDDVYSNNHSWTQMRHEVGLPTLSSGEAESALLRAVGRLLHVDDQARIDRYTAFLRQHAAPNAEALSDFDRRCLRMLIASLTTKPTSASLQEGIDEVWSNPQVRAELADVLTIRAASIDRLHPLVGLPGIPLAVHARYTRIEILSAFGVGSGASVPSWQAGVLWVPDANTDLFAFTLDKSSGGFSPTTRYKDYALSRDQIHWESQSATSVESEAGQRYIHQVADGTNIVLFARLRADDRAFWCLGPASYVRHEGDRPIAFVWQLDHPLPADLYTSFAAAVA